MAFVLVSIFIIAVLTLSAWRVNGDITCPTVMYGVFWIISLIVAQSYSDVISDIQFSTMLIFSSGAVLFHLGYRKGYSDGDGSIEEIEINPSYFRPIIIVLSLFFIYVMYEFITKGVGENLYNMLKSEDNKDLTLGGYFKKIIEFTTIGILLIYWKTQDSEVRKSVQYYVFLLTIMGFLCALSTPSRNAMLQFFLPVIVVYLCTHSLSKKRQLFYVIVGVIVFLCYYSYVSANKYSYRYEKEQNSLGVLTSELQVYLSGSVIAFDQSFEEHSCTRSGRNTFRFFYAFFDKQSAETLVNDFFSYQRLTTNVFTIYDFYVRDFGPLYALFMQFLIGLLHGRAYKNRQSSMGLFFLSMLSYPLIMQFFSDQYFSLTSTWVQIIIISLLLFRTKIFAFISPK